MKTTSVSRRVPERERVNISKNRAILLVFSVLICIAVVSVIFLKFPHPKAILNYGDISVAIAKVPLLNSSDDVVGYYEIKIKSGDKDIAIEKSENGSIIFSLKNKTD
ncbi:MAG: hypothetical protein V1886_03305 [archaeon]